MDPRMRLARKVEDAIRTAMADSAAPEHIAAILRDVWNGILEHAACGSAGETEDGAPTCTWSPRGETAPPWHEHLGNEYSVRPTFCARCQAPRTRHGGQEHARLTLEDAS